MKPKTPRPLKIVLRVWDGMICKYVEKPARKCVACGAEWLVGQSAHHFADCLIAEVQESFQ